MNRLERLAALVKRIETDEATKNAHLSEVLEDEDRWDFSYEHYDELRCDYLFVTEDRLGELLSAVKDLLFEEGVQV